MCWNLFFRFVNIGFLTFVFLFFLCVQGLLSSIYPDLWRRILVQKKKIFSKSVKLYGPLNRKMHVACWVWRLKLHTSSSTHRMFSTIFIPPPSPPPLPKSKPVNSLYCNLFCYSFQYNFLLEHQRSCMHCLYICMIYDHTCLHEQKKSTNVCSLGLTAELIDDASHLKVFALLV